MGEKDDISTVIHVNAATITDNYWIRPMGSELTYEDVRFTDDYFSNFALKGSYNSFNRAANSKHFGTPELTNVGILYLSTIEMTVIHYIEGYIWEKAMS